MMQSEMVGLESMIVNAPMFVKSEKVKPSMRLAEVTSFSHLRPTVEESDSVPAMMVCSGPAWLRMTTSLPSRRMM